MRLPVLHETDELLAVDKPAGALSVPSRMGPKDERPCVLYALSETYGRAFWPVHRLDEEVSGLLVFAKNAATHRRLNALFETRAVDKAYEAWCDLDPASPPPTAEQLFEDLLVRGKKRAFVAPHGKLAVTLARADGTVDYAGQRLQRYALSPRTGRSHQLRVQLARRGWPIAGDALYGAKSCFLDGAVALRAVRLRFEQTTITAPSLASYVASQTSA